MGTNTRQNSVLKVFAFDSSEGGGNPAGVYLDADSLSIEQMQGDGTAGSVACRAKPALGSHGRARALHDAAEPKRSLLQDPTGRKQDPGRRLRANRRSKALS